MISVTEKMNSCRANIRVAIIDDNQYALDYLSGSLEEYPYLVLCGTANNAESGSAMILKEHPDLVFLDVELPDKSGLEMLRLLREEITWPFDVVFYTAYDKYLLQALRESAFDYLLKPYNKEELDKVICRYLELRKETEEKSLFTDSLTRLLSSEETFLIATVDGFKVLRTAQIVYFEYERQRKLWKVVLNDHKELQMKRNTNAKDITGYSRQFIQINRNVIINVIYLSGIKGTECQLYPPFDNISGLEASIRLIHELQERFNQI
ncbi:MAG TPA: response regulator [Bacteroidales bacterium]|nr:response regulator [Bacteroidales bacterium]